MNRILRTTLIATLCSVGFAAHAQDKTYSGPSGQEKPGGGTPGKTMAAGER